MANYVTILTIVLLTDEEIVMQKQRLFRLHNNTLLNLSSQKGNKKMKTKNLFTLLVQISNYASTRVLEETMGLLGLLLKERSIPLNLMEMLFQERHRSRICSFCLCVVPSTRLHINDPEMKRLNENCWICCNGTPFVEFR